MKKILVVLAVLSTVLFASCGAKLERDEGGCVLTLKDAVKDAQKNKRNIILVITNEGGDVTSSAFVANVIKSEEFANTVAKDFTIYHWDASQSAFEKTVASPSASKEEVKAAEKAEKIMNDNLNFAINIGAGSYSPQFFILTKEGYPVTEIQYEDFEDEIKTEDFSALVHKYDSEVEMYNKMIEATKTGSKEERLKAIDNVYTTTNQLYRIALNNLWQQGVALDKKNETGITGKFIYSICEAKAAEKYSKQDVAGAINVLTTTAENPALGGEEVQQCYYLAAYLLSSTGSTDMQLMADYLDKSYAAAPNTEIASSIKATAEYYRNFDPNTMIDLDYEDSGIEMSDLIEIPGDGAGENQ